MASTNLFFFSFLFLQYVGFLACAVIAQSQVSLPYAGVPIMKNPNSVDALQSKSVASLEKAQQLLQRSLALHGSFGNCRAQLNTALGSIRWVETLLLEDNYREASNQLLSAKQTISDCNAILSSSPVRLMPILRCWALELQINCNTIASCWLNLLASIHDFFCRFS